MPRLPAALAFCGILASSAAGSARAQALEPYRAELFEALSSSGAVVVVQFHSGDSAACARQARALEAAAGRLGPVQLALLQADFDAERELRRRYLVAARTTLLVFRGERLLDRSTGLLEGEDIRDFLLRTLAQARGGPKARPKGGYRPRR